MDKFIQLTRPKVSLMVGLSSFAGACLFCASINIRHLIVVLSVTLLSAGCSALNQVQEVKRDKLMLRTSERPLVSGRVSKSAALMFALLLIALSGALIINISDYNSLLFIPFIMLIYNFTYTPLKPATPFALLIGSVTGAVPPVMGYALMGGYPFNPNIMIIAGVLYLWQTPHFALLTIRYCEDYTRAGFKTLASEYGEEKEIAFIVLWLISYFCALFLVTASGLYLNVLSSAMHLALSISFALLLIFFKGSSRLTFNILNLSAALFFLLLVVDRIIL